MHPDRLDNIKFAPMATPDPPVLSEPTRARPVVVHRNDGSPPVLYGVTVPAQCLIEDLVEAARQVAGIPSDRHLVPYLSCFAFTSNVKTSSPFVDGKVKVDDAFQSQWRKPLQVYAVAAPSKGSDIDCIVVTLENYGRYVSGETAVNPVLILAGGPKDAGGGPKAAMAVATALVTSLRHVMRGSEDAAGTARLIKNVAKALQYGNLGGPKFDLLFRQKPNAWVKGRRLSLCLNCNESGILYPGFDFSKWRDVRDASAESLKVMEEHIKARREHKAIADDAAALPRKVLEELENNCRPAEPNAVIPSNGSARDGVRYKATVLPSGEDPTKGVLDIRVFVWRRVLHLHGRAFFTPHDSWPLSTGRRTYYDDLRMSMLVHTLRLANWDNQAFRAMEAQKAEGQSKNSSMGLNKNIPSLMEALETGEAPAATQPRGLTVRMHPYQLQSLKFMLDCEKQEGGFRDKLWLPLTAVDGTRYWYSPLLGKTSLHVPAMPRGGFCCEEASMPCVVVALHNLTAFFLFYRRDGC